MFRQILVPTDFSQKHINPLEVATNLAKKYKSTTHILHVVEIIPNTTFSEYKKFYNNLEKKAQKQMSILMSDYEDKSIQILPHIIYGNRVQEILKFVKEHEIDLIIMNSHKVELENPIHNWGTISYRVALLSETPIMLVK
ncbi:MAG: universal stress protein [Syntrophales bacterium]|nr:universal stress protein [Syntrophales bacterium]